MITTERLVGVLYSLKKNNTTEKDFSANAVYKILEVLIDESITDDKEGD